MIGTSLHFLGKQAEARRHIQHMLISYVIPDQRSYLIRFQFDQQVLAYVFLARILWLQGFPEQAVRPPRQASREPEKLSIRSRRALHSPTPRVPLHCSSAI